MEAQLRRIEATKAQAAALQKRVASQGRPVNARQTPSLHGVPGTRLCENL